MKISLYNASTSKSIYLGTDILSINRESFSCNDKRIARNHGQITVIDSEIKIKSTHTNPIFYKKTLPEFKILNQGEEIFLGNGHFFSLLPNEHIYEIRVTEEILAGNPKTITTSSGSEIIIESKQRKRSLSTPSSDRSITPDLDFNDSSDVNNITIPNNTELPKNNPEPSSSSSTRKRSANEEVNVDPNKKIKPDPDAPVDQNVNQPSTSFIKIKTDPDAPIDQDTVHPTTVISIIKPDPDGPSSSTSSTTATTTVKTESASTDNNTSSSSTPVTSTTTVRNVCQFGIRCYRHHEDHRREMAHPGDMDYRRPDFIPAPDTAPDCEFGAGCYRRNPQHFREFQHPPPNQNPTVQIPPVTNNRLPPRNPRFYSYNEIDDEFVGDFDNDDDYDDDFVDDFDDVDDFDYQLGRNDMTSSDDEENNIEE